MYIQDDDLVRYSALGRIQQADAIFDLIGHFSYELLEEMQTNRAQHHLPIGGLQ